MVLLARGSRVDRVHLNELVRHHVEVDLFGLETALLHEVVELGHLHLRRVLGRVGTESRARVRKEDERERMDVALQAVVHLLLPDREVEEVIQLEPLPHAEPTLELAQRLPLERLRLTTPFEAWVPDERRRVHRLFGVLLAEEVGHEGGDHRGLAHALDRSVLVERTAREALLELRVLESTELVRGLRLADRHLVQRLRRDERELDGREGEGAAVPVPAALVARDLRVLVNLPGAYELAWAEAHLRLC